ncbi:MAG: glycoside hydrolase family 3 C-terminal domain-containing protein [Bacteroidales bacterium]|nr:glycoside hydrolase family 3 C-terminal domain-containing protein [Bacteroidales bacterium]
MKRILLTMLLLLSLGLGACQSQKWTEKECDGHVVVTQKGGATLGYSPGSGISLISDKGFAFKDLNRNGTLDPYEDWRRPVEERVKDLARQLSVEEIAGLMLYSNHQAIPATSYDVSTYEGKPYSAGEANPWDLTDHQKKFLAEDHLRHVLVTIIESPETAARWNNRLQAYVEGLDHGIPANNSSDPRHSARADAEFNAGGGGKISMWPGPLGLAATFSPELLEEFGKIASEEYRALGFATALSPQVDIATDPRWYRCHGTLGEDPKLAADLARAYCDGFQTTEGSKDGWGLLSVNTMVKHWPGGGACEAGRDAHYGFGKYAVYPNGNYPLHKIPFTEGAFKLAGKTRKASAVMPYYTISTGQGAENVANAYDADIISRQLREEAGFDGVVCTDWVVTGDEIHTGVHSGKPWGVEHLSVAERHYKALMAGVDQFGGNNDKVPVLEAYEMGVREHGEEWMMQRMRESAGRLLANIFRTGLFENPYLDPEATAAAVGSARKMEAGYEAQLRSAVLLKNHGNVLPVEGRRKIYIPKRTLPAYRNFWGGITPAAETVPVGRNLAERYYIPVDTPEEADMAIVFIASPMGGSGYDLEEARRGGTGYIPISLQYSDYTARKARPQSLAGGDPYEDFTNRSYLGKKARTVNRCDMELVAATRRAMGDKPVIVAVNASNPFVPAEIEPLCDALFITFDVQNQVILDFVTGKREPSGLLPMQMPADMDTVEEQAEDTPRDMRCYTDSDGDTYDFAFGLNWKGTINDKRVQQYR